MCKEVSIPQKNKLLHSMVNRQPSKEDPMGSYTGIPMDETDVPVQDVDYL